MANLTSRVELYALLIGRKCLQINAQTELALRYNDISPLENHHCSIAFRLFEDPNCNIFRNLPPESYKRIREGMIRCILATDMGKTIRFG